MTGQTFARRKLGKTSLEVSVLGMGGAPFGGLLKAVEKSGVDEAIAAGLAEGVSYFDTAPYYGFGRSERRMGDGLRGKAGIVLSTKVGRLLEPGAAADPAAYGWPDALPFHPVFDYGYDAVMRSWEHSLHRLGLDHVDILYMHDIGEMTHGRENGAKHFRDAMSGGYRALDELRRGGQVKAIGLGVNEWQVCRAALDHGQWDAFLLAGRYTLLEQEPAETLFPHCRAAGTSIVVGGPFNSGILAGGDTYDYGKAPESIRNRVGKLKATCAEFSVPLPAAALQFPLAHPVVASVIPGPRNADEFAGIVGWTRTTIPAGFWQKLEAEGLVEFGAPVPVGNPYLG